MPKHRRAMEYDPRAREVTAITVGRVVKVRERVAPLLKSEGILVPDKFADIRVTQILFGSWFSEMDIELQYESRQRDTVVENKEYLFAWNVHSNCVGIWPIENGQAIISGQVVVVDSAFLSWPEIAHRMYLVPSE